jgi:hypothetical protein
MSLLTPFGKIFLKARGGTVDLWGFLWVLGRTFFPRTRRRSARAAKSLRGITPQVFSFIRLFRVRRSAFRVPNSPAAGSEIDAAAGPVS